MILITSRYEINYQKISTLKNKSITSTCTSNSPVKVTDDPQPMDAPVSVATLTQIVNNIQGIVATFPNESRKDTYN